MGGFEGQGRGKDKGALAKVMYALCSRVSMVVSMSAMKQNSLHTSDASDS